jgi:hypothetical protein
MGYLARRIAVLAVIGCSVMVAGQAQAFEWVDDSMSYWYGPYFREPGVTSPTQPGGADIGKNIIEFTHADGWKYGTNFFDAQLMMSNRQDPAVATNHQAMGAYEGYVLYRSDLSLNAMTGSKAFTFGPFSDVGINSGFDWDSKNTAYGVGRPVQGNEQRRIQRADEFPSYLDRGQFMEDPVQAGAGASRVRRIR